MNKISDDNHLWVSWEEYNHAIEKLVLKVHASGWKFDQVLCLARGGMRPGDVCSRIFDVPLAILAASSYREEAGTVRSELDIAKHITISRGALAGRILLVDDLVDSGITLEQVQRHLREHYAPVTEVKTAVIWWKQCSIIEPDFYVDFLPTNPWIHQPFEDYDDMRPHQLAAQTQHADKA
ncbi:phosphoribosyltransferase [Glaciimonas soli]|uniref:Phosphoribosyltransferase n=1 Tax=Glaciimonas soli TaxID=2590999 RepID=A0A843YRG6_9BURK|nr:phosphoribosyltransferase family protein [Glaciimonas soli]MQQ99315.1 phosphoribosyltransferase [Glaciimonas soli]